MCDSKFWIIMWPIIIAGALGLTGIIGYCSHLTDLKVLECSKTKDPIECAVAIRVDSQRLLMYKGQN